jgi:hypothetical protein
MPLHSRVSRSLLIATVVAGFAASSGTALADPSDNGLEHRSDNAQANGTSNNNADDHKPAGSGGGRKVG